MKKLLCLMMVLLMCCVSFADTNTSWIGPANGLWNDPCNWDPAGSPSSGRPSDFADGVAFLGDKPAGYPCVIDSTHTGADAAVSPKGYMNLGLNGYAEILMTGGEFKSGELWMGRGGLATKAVFTMTDGNATSDHDGSSNKNVYCPGEGDVVEPVIGEFNILGGYFYCSNTLQVAFRQNGMRGSVVVDNGATLECREALFVGPNDHPDWDNIGTVTIGHDSRVQVNNYWRIFDEDSAIDLRGGELVIKGKGDQRDNDWYNGNEPTNKIDKLVGFGGRVEVIASYDADEDETIWTTPFYFDPTPADTTDPEFTETAYPAIPLTLSWVLPEPNDPADSVIVDVYFDTDANGDNGTQVVISENDRTSVDVTVNPSEDYYWKIVATDPNSGGTPFEIDTAVFKFTTESGNLAPIVEAGPDSYTYLEGTTGTFTVAGDVSNEDLDLNTNNDISWSVTPSAGVSFDDDSSPTTGVTFDSVQGAAAGDYVFTLTADDGEFVVTDQVIVKLYADKCEAAKVELPYTPTNARQIGDTDYDCDVDVEDLMALTDSWLDDASL